MSTARRPEIPWEPWFFFEDEPHVEDYRVVNPMVLSFADAIRKGQSRKEVARDFWQAIARGNVLNIVKGYSKDGLFKRRVFVYSGYKGPFGCLTWKLAGRPQAAGALAVHGFGGRNAVPCECCERNWAAMRVGSDQTACFVPFWECVSLPNAYNGACSNCLYHETQTSCSYRDDDFYKKYGYGVVDPTTRQRRESGCGIASSMPSNVASTNTTQFYRHELIQLVENQRRMLPPKSRSMRSAVDQTHYSADGEWEDGREEE
ncbi:hypothetical protein LZ31DRAFT_601796 [Colletotrichum somersetense]|nr:hypothetical protein LZ31DRAFT_601796 [Colletotrichum somersetense]